MRVSGATVCDTGTVVAVQMQAAGYNWEIDAFERIAIRNQQRSFESTFLLLPPPAQSAGVWTREHVLLSTPHHNYTVLDYTQLFTALRYPQVASLQHSIFTNII